MSIEVPDEEFDRLTDVLLKAYNDQFNRPTPLTVANTAAEFVVPRGGYTNAVQITTNSNADHLVLKVNIEYVNIAIIEVTPFKLEQIENAETGPDSKLFVAMARLPKNTFPMSSRKNTTPVIPTINWNQEEFDVELEENEDTFTLTATRSAAGPELTVEVQVQFGSSEADTHELVFEEGETEANLDIEVPLVPSSYTATIQAGEGYTVGEDNVVTGDITAATP